MKFSEKIQIIRKHHSLSQDEMADRLNVTRQTVARWETGQTLPDADKLIAIGKMFSVTIDYLLRDDVDSSTGKLTDYQTLKIVFWISTALIFGGLVISLLAWHAYRNIGPVALGLILEILGCVSFLGFRPRDADRELIRYARRQFYFLNIWMLLPTPFYVVIEIIVYYGDYTTILPYLIGGALYLMVSALVSFYLIYKFRR